MTAISNDDPLEDEPKLEILDGILKRNDFPGPFLVALESFKTVFLDQDTLTKDERVKMLSEIYHIVFFQTEKALTGNEVRGLLDLFEYVAMKRRNKRDIWDLWTPGDTASCVMFLDKTKHDPGDLEYNDRMDEFTAAISEVDDEMFSTVHPCEYEAALGIETSRAMDFGTRDHVGKFLADIALKS